MRDERDTLDQRGWILTEDRECLPRSLPISLQLSTNDSLSDISLYSVKYRPLFAPSTFS